MDINTKDVLKAISSGELDGDLRALRRGIEQRERSLLQRFKEDELVVIPIDANLTPRYLLGVPLKFKKALKKNAQVEVADQSSLPAGARFTGTFRCPANLLVKYEG